jgi:hypothetical protein
VPLHLRSVRRAVLLFLALTMWLGGAVVSAAGQPAALPAGIPPAKRAEIEGVTETAQLTTRVAAEPFITRREVFEYLLDHPDFATHVTRALKLARYKIWSTPEGMYLDDGWGVRGQFRVVYAANGTRIFHAKGEYRKALVPTVQGEAITTIEYVMTPAADGKTLVQPTVSGFLRIDHRLAVLALKTVSAVAQRKADLEAARLMRVFARVSRAIEENAGAVWTAVSQRPDVPARELQEFGRLLNVR